MNWAHVHLILNHVPVLGTVFGFALLAWGVMRRDDGVRRAALGTFLVVALAALAVYFTGEPAEAAVEHLAGTAEPALEAHESAALVSLIAVEVVGALALAGLVLARAPRAASALTRLALLGALAAGGLIARTANLGGQIRHAELRGDRQPAVEDDEHHAREKGGPQ